jgi:predicted small metal-binding protein
MKIMTCKQLGGACDLEFKANTFEEVSELRKKHGKEMFEKNDAAHLEVMQKMQKLMQNPDDMKKWFKKKEKSLIQ